MDESRRNNGDGVGGNMPGSFRAGTYNIRHGKGLDGRVDLDRVAQVIVKMSADIVGLQEVDKNRYRSGHIDQAGYLANATGMFCCFAPGLRQGMALYGNAVLSRHPIIYWESQTMRSLRERRVLLRTVIEIKGRRINFFTTHLGLNHKERLRHINKIIIPMIKGNRNTILTGDFNAYPDSPELQSLQEVLRDSCNSHEELTFPSDSPRVRIDYVMHSPGFQVSSTEVISQDASDHNPLIVSF
ncbi:MAG: endonuclease [Syntrophomonadaceae bacterium]|nr:endonuclease [Syntrophomonadaceae bacterium]